MSAAFYVPEGGDFVSTELTAGQPLIRASAWRLAER
jgi:hypothetical protein